MKIIDTGIHYKYPKQFKELICSLDTNTISDINSRTNIYCGETNFLQEFGITQKQRYHDTIISRIVGNIPPHYDNLDGYLKHAYLLVLDVSVANQFVDSPDLPMLYQAGKFLKMRKGDIIEFNQRTEHALFWDRRIDIAVFWPKYLNFQY